MNIFIKIINSIKSLFIKKKDKPVIPYQINHFSIHFMINLASQNGFIITDDGVYDTKTKNYIYLDKDKAKRQLDHNKSEVYKKYPDEMIKTKAIRNALKQHTRFMIEVLPMHTPDLMF